VSNSKELRASTESLCDKYCRTRPNSCKKIWGLWRPHHHWVRADDAW